jgi:tRNA(Phe) wybutosine-synthesizing methylase Tyw3
MLPNDYIINKPSNTTINTREKFGSLVKKVLKYLYENKTKLFRFQELIQETQKILK